MHVPLAVCALITFFPFWAMLAISVQPGRGIELPGSLLPRDISFAAFSDALGSDRIYRWAINSTVYALVSVVLVLLFASMPRKRFLANAYPAIDANSNTRTTETSA